MKKYSNPYILGAFTGCLLTTITYMVLCTGVTLTWSVRSELKRETVVGEVSPQSPARGGRVVEVFPGNQVTEQKQLLRDLLLTVVTSPRTGVEEIYDNVNNTWGEGVPNFRIVVGAMETQLPFIAEAALGTKCEDFPSTGDYLSPKQLFCVLEAIYNLYHTRYQWFFLATHTTYVSVRHLERLLRDIDGDGKFMYMGNPHRAQGHCVGDSGFILNQATLKEVVTSLKVPCTEADALRTSEGDSVLGACLEEQLHLTCSPLKAQVSCVCCRDAERHNLTQTKRSHG